MRMLWKSRWKGLGQERMGVGGARELPKHREAALPAGLRRSADILSPISWARLRIQHGLGAESRVTSLSLLAARDDGGSNKYLPT